MIFSIKIGLSDVLNWKLPTSMESVNLNQNPEPEEEVQDNNEEIEEPESL